MTYAPGNSLVETSLQEIYGDTYASDFVEHNRRYVADLLVSNIAGLNFREVKHDFSVLFNEEIELPNKWLNHVITNVQKLNPNILVSRITNKNSIPRIIDEPQITYLKVLDLNRKKLYILFLTPYILDAL